MTWRNRQIYLIGFMGSGKSTVGPLLAEALGRPFIDLDTEVEVTTGRKIAQIFEQEGEASFRRLESDCLRRIAAGPASVVALGGGAYQEPVNRRTISASGLTVWLRVSFETARERALGDRLRPLAQDPAHFEELFKKRQEIYREAEIQIGTDDLDPASVRDRILHQLRWPGC